MQRKLKLKAGDCFCTRNPMMLGRAINFVQKLHSKDNQSKYSHAGIMLSPEISFEALWTNRKQDFYKAYAGTEVLVGRHKKMDSYLSHKGWHGIKKHEGKLYAGHRLFLFFIPFMAKYLSLGLAVCSELTMKFLCKAGLTGTWKGWNPDDVSDMIHKWREWEVIFEGKLPK
ncbi:hypothetical protein KAR91_75245 [Candidatus Pacearchaeota archaeon]|nr:hypothetical protein [Candidatus Pacearchaeota archaeon]